jgi:hypothetical protein
MKYVIFKFANEKQIIYEFIIANKSKRNSLFNKIKT